MKILKKCLTCGAEFIASKMSNKYCCRECERDASRKREAKRKKSVRESEKEAALDKERDAVASRPFLTPSDVALLLDMSVSTVYRCFYSGIIKAVEYVEKPLSVVRILTNTLRMQDLIEKEVTSVSKNKNTIPYKRLWISIKLDVKLYGDVVTD